MQYFQKELETMSADQKKVLQSERLVKMVKYVYENQKPYRAKMDAIKLKPDDIKSIDDIYKLPYTVKQDLRDAYPFGMMARPRKDLVVEMVARKLEEQGVTGFVLNVGGNVRTIGTKGDGDKWVVGIENPADDEEKPYLAYLGLAGEALVTSGSYQRYYLVDGKRYHHIIDPDTLMPSEGFTSVSILTGSSADGDALSTALFCMSFEDGLALIESLPNTEAMWVFHNGQEKTSSGFDSYRTR